MLNYLTHLVSFKQIGSSLENTQYKTITFIVWLTKYKLWFCVMFLYLRSNLFETRQMLLLLFSINKDQFWFFLMLRTSSAEVWHTKKLPGKCKLLSPLDSYKGD